MMLHLSSPAPGYIATNEHAEMFRDKFCGEWV